MKSLIKFELSQRQEKSGLFGRLLVLRVRRLQPAAGGSGATPHDNPFVIKLSHELIGPQNQVIGWDRGIIQKRCCDAEPDAGDRIQLRDSEPLVFPTHAKCH